MNHVNFKLLTIFATALLAIAGLNTVEGTHGDKVKDLIDHMSESLKKGVDALGDDMHAAQEYLDNYHWKGLLQDEAASGPVTLQHLQLNGHGKTAIVKPGERIEGLVQLNLDAKQCSALSMYRVVLGIKGVGAQTTLHELGLTARETLEKFTLIAPTAPGIYQIRFKTVEALFEQDALNAWIDEEGNEPDGTTTIGIIVVKS